MGKNDLEKEINVHEHDHQKYAVWYGGTVMADSADYHTNIAISRENYLEYGSHIMRASHIFKEG